jgi:hypothetical protein
MGHATSNRVSLNACARYSIRVRLQFIADHHEAYVQVMISRVAVCPPVPAVKRTKALVPPTVAGILMLHEVVQPRVGNRIRDGHRQRGAVVNHVHMEDIGACCLPDSSGPDRTSQLPLQGFLTSSHTRTMYNPSRSRRTQCRRSGVLDREGDG